ncbi:MAG: hypothetical protein J5I92_12810 [Thiogranum sp.]|nr:hypothetical protein [Thiogranum sp.]
MSSEENFRQFVELRLGVSDIEIDLATRAETQHATDLMAGQAQFSLDIFSRDLDGLLYERQAFLDALTALCRRNRKSRIRFLVQDPVSAVRRSLRLLELSRKLSSSVEIREPHQDYQHFNEAFMIVDECGLIHRGLADRYEGTANFYAPVEARRKLAFFTEVWERSEVNPEFRRLYL